MSCDGPDRELAIRHAGEKLDLRRVADNGGCAAPQAAVATAVATARARNRVADPDRDRPAGDHEVSTK